MDGLDYGRHQLSQYIHRRAPQQLDIQVSAIRTARPWCEDLIGRQANVLIQQALLPKKQNRYPQIALGCGDVPSNPIYAEKLPQRREPSTAFSISIAVEAVKR